MGRDEILAFLEAIDAELVEHAGEGERLDLYLIGRSALIVRYGLNLATRDVDIVHVTSTVPGWSSGPSSSSARGRGTRSAWASTSSRCPRACRRSRAAISHGPRTSRDGGVSCGRDCRSRTTWR